MAEKRDLQKDLRLCERATPGNWKVETIYMDEPGYEEYIQGQDIVVSIDKETMYVIARINWCNPVEANAHMMAEARQGWPHAIQRAIEAEKRVKELEDVLELAYQALTEGMKDVASEDRYPQCARIRLGAKKAIREVLGVDKN